MLTLGQASRKTGKPKTTISRAIAAGRLDARRSNNGGWLIDPADLERVYPAGASATVAKPSPEMVALRERIAEQAETIRDLRLRLDASDERVARLLRPWWRRMAG